MSGSFIPTLRPPSGVCPDLMLYPCISSDRCGSKCAPPTVRTSVGGHCCDSRPPVLGVSYRELCRFRCKNSHFFSIVLYFSAHSSRLRYRFLHVLLATLPRLPDRGGNSAGRLTVPAAIQRRWSRSVPAASRSCALFFRGPHGNRGIEKWRNRPRRNGKWQMANVIF